MSALVLELRGEGEGWIARALGGALAGVVVPAVLVGDAAAQSKDLLEVEAIVPEVLATRFAGEPQAAAIARAAERGPVLAWCAFVTSLPRPSGGFVSDAFLRFAIGLGSTRERLAPIAALRVERGAMSLRLGVHGAPVLPPPSRDRGGPIDRAWARSAELAREDLGRALARLEGVELALAGEGVDAATLASLAKAWNIEETRLDAGGGAIAVPSLVPGKCVACRHANHGTEDLAREGLLACSLAGPRPLHLDPVCEVTWQLDGKRYFAFEPYDGGNSTWGQQGELRVRPPKAPRK